MRRALALVGLAFVLAPHAAGGQEPAPPPPAAGTGTIVGTVAFPEGAQPRRARQRYPGQAPGAEKGKKTEQFPAVVYVTDVTGPPVTGVKAAIEQREIDFSPKVLAIRTGTAVDFPNRDDVYHNVLSYSTPKRFDLGRYAKDESREVVFDKPGVVRLGCEIHEHMRGYIVVLEQPHFAVTDAEGGFRLAAVPAGTHRLAVWHEKGKAEPVDVEVRAGAEASVTFALAR